MKKQLFLTVLALLSMLSLHASVQIGDLYYDLDETTLTAEVTYNLWNSGRYSGNIVIPSSVTYEGTTYSVTSIGSSAFFDCTGLTSITIPNSVTSIGIFAFDGCTGLTSITIPENVTSIGECAFQGCTGLTSITIPNSVTSIGYSTFQDCSGLTSVVWNAKSCSCEHYSNSSDPFSDAAASITSFTFGNEVETIPDYLCGGLSALTSIVIPNSVTSIGSGAFSGCTGLTSITIPNSVTSIGSCAFSSCTGLTSITIPNSITRIGDMAFTSCTGLTSITIPNSVTRIGNMAFYGCTGLTSVTIPNSVIDCDYGVFGYCKNITSITAPAALFSAEDYIYSANVLSLEAKPLASLTLTSGTMNESVFAVIQLYKKTLKTLDVCQVENTTLSDEAFKGFYNLETLRLPANLTSIPYMAVGECLSLQSISIPASVEEIDSRAFENCRSLQSITFEESSTPQNAAQHAPAATTSALRRIGNWAFYNCHQLQNLTIPEGVTEIGDAAFYGCTYLQDMTLPKSIQSIGDNTFALCSKLQKITVKAVTPPTIQAKTFYDVNRAIPVYVPDEVVADYKDDPYWGEFNIQGIAAAVDNISTTFDQSTTQKVLINGHVYILRGDEVYTLTGAKVK